MKKLFSLILFIFSIFFTIGGVNAANNNPEYIKIGNLKLTSDTPYYMVEEHENYELPKAVENCELGVDGCMAYYNYTDGELVLNNYNDSSSIMNEIENVNLSINLVGENIINAYNADFGIKNNFGDILIYSDDNASLKINFGSNRRENAVGIVNEGEYNVTISGNASVNINLTLKSISDQKQEQIGIKSFGDVNVIENANLKIFANTNLDADSDHVTYGINAKQFIVNTNGDIYLDVLYADKDINGDVDLIKFNKVTDNFKGCKNSYGYAYCPKSIVLKYANKFLIDDYGSKILILDQKGRTGIIIHNSDQYKYYINTKVENVILGNDLDVTSISNYDDLVWKLNGNKTIDLNGFTLDTNRFDVSYFARSTKGVFTFNDSSLEKSGVINLKTSSSYGIYVSRYSNSYGDIKSGCSYDLVFDGVTYNYNGSSSLLYIEDLYSNTINIKYQNNPVFVSNKGISLFRTNSSNVNMNAESLTYKVNGKRDRISLGTSNDSYYSTKTFAELINDYYTKAFLNGNEISLNQRFDTMMPDSVDGDNIIEIKPIEYPYDFTRVTVSGITNKVYNGKPQTQKLVVMYDKKVLKNNLDYTVTYKNNINAGTSSIIITGIGNYAGKVSKTFKIVKANNNLYINVVNKSVKFKKLKLKKLSLSNSIKIKNKKGKVSYTKMTGSSKKLLIDKNTGVITVKKKTKKGKYKLKVKVLDSGNNNFNSSYKVVTVTIRVK